MNTIIRCQCDKVMTKTEKTIVLAVAYVILLP
jgi:hypothetical protein